MDDLTQIHGIGRTIAKKLVAAGYDSFFTLGGTTPGMIKKAGVGGRPSNYASWIEGAKALFKASVKPTDRQMTDEELSALVQSWDNARAELKAAGEAVAGIQYQIDTAEAGSDIRPFEGQLTQARGRVASAQAAIEALTPLPEGLRLPNAKTAEIPEGSQMGGPVQPGDDAQAPDHANQGPGDGAANDAPVEVGAVGSAPDTHSTSESSRDGEAGNVASLTQADFAPMVAGEVGRVGDYVRALAATDPTAALVHLNDERRRAQLMVRTATSIDAELAKIEVELTRTVPAWPLTPIRIYGGEQPIGVMLMLEPDVFKSLEAAGAVSGKAPD